ncbi:MAG: lamin tail domain-containing protein [Spirosomaceae bacterium]|nr:lamin tail domain-containing protein [Spirosomataceae bacterium]
MRLLFVLLLLPFLGIAQSTNELIISEIMADPTPTRGLPEKEYLELYNRTDRAISLAKVKLQIGITTQIFGNYTIQPKEYIILCERTDEATFSKFGKTLVINNFTLNNTGTTIALRNERNQTVFSVSYTDKWYDPKRNGGYSLEIIDTNFPCVEEANWTSSENQQGGTPAKENSVKANKPDLTPPSLLRFEQPNLTTIKLIFSEKLDSTSAVSKLAYGINNGLIINQVAIESPTNKSINLTLSQALQDNTIYQLNLKNIADCSGNILRDASVLLGNVKAADSMDVVLNEVLFDPLPDGVDYVEIYNRSNKILSLKDWSLANIDKSGKVASIRKITTDNYILRPKQYLVLTSNAQIVQNQYFKATKENFLEMPSLPSYPDDSGTVMIKEESRSKNETITNHPTTPKIGTRRRVQKASEHRAMSIRKVCKMQANQTWFSESNPKFLPPMATVSMSQSS